MDSKPEHTARQLDRVTHSFRGPDDVLDNPWQAGILKAGANQRDQVNVRVGANASPFAAMLVAHRRMSLTRWARVDGVKPVEREGRRVCHVELKRIVPVY
jgi:hypothetical protein